MSDDRVCVPQQLPETAGLIAEAVEVATALHRTEAIDALEPSRRFSTFRHLTASVMAVDPVREVILVVEQNGVLLQPGGHAEVGDSSLRATAIRELREETGFNAPGMEPIDVNIHEVMEDGGSIGHVDVRFAAFLPALHDPHNEEGLRTEWVAFTDPRLGSDLKLLLNLSLAKLNQ